jgi:hypothetical protein
MINNKIINAYSWIRLILSGLLFLAHDLLHISRNLFIGLFIVINILMIVWDSFMYFRIHKKISIVDIGIFVLFNFIGFKIIFNKV